MRLLIDGYNLMFALGLLGKRLGPDGFRKVRHRFLNDLAAVLDPVEAHQTTVVFDASSPPGHLPAEGRHKGMTVVFAVDDDDADTRLERLIAKHSAPKGLTVVSSDHRVRRAASRRGAKAVTADEFWSTLEGRKRSKGARPSQPVTDEERARREGPSPEEAGFWLAEFQDVANEPDVREARRGGGFVPTDEEIARIEREVDEED
jgi:predicted RNA-binding protein with PIN domain